MFHGTRKPLSLWFRAVFEFVSRKHGCNAMDPQRLLGLSRKVAWAWLHKIRDAMVDPNRRPLTGTVQIDETMIGASEEQGMKCGRARFPPVGCASQETLPYWVANNVAEGSTARTETDSSGTVCLEHAYEHEVDVTGRDGRKAVEKFPHIHLVFALFKRVVESTYCHEFVFRFNRRHAKFRTLLLQRVLENAVRRRAHIVLTLGAARTRAWSYEHSEITYRQAQA